MQNIGALKIPSRTDAEQALSQFRLGRRQTFFQFALAPGKKYPSSPSLSASVAE